MPELPTQKLGPYEIVSILGRGGMGVVYKARDTRLNRFVAIKLLPPERTANADAKARFLEEARAASLLNHPNIITIYDIVQSQEQYYIVMEFVPGKTLDALIPRSGMRLSTLLELGVQMAEGLSRAHEAGIVHRDFKPTNVIVTGSGQVKILDFGLAKLASAPQMVAESDETVTEVATRVGMVAGTPAYMSPEQASGKPVDHRSDIFSFGAVLYEMATGHRPFHADTSASTMAAVINLEPQPPSQLTPDLPRDLERIIARCLRKDPSRRQQNLGDVRLQLEELREDTTSGTLAPSGVTRQRRSRMLYVAVAGTALFLAGATAWIAKREALPQERVVALTTYPGTETNPDFSPDGKQLAFSWNGEHEDNYDIYVKLIGSSEALRLTHDPATEDSPVWSPDGKQIAFIRAGEPPGIYLVSPLGGPVKRRLEITVALSSLSWSPDGTRLLFAKARADHESSPDAGSIFALRVAGGEPERILQAKAGDEYRFPRISPDGRMLAYVLCSGPASTLQCELDWVGLSNGVPTGQSHRLLPRENAFLGLTWTADSRSIVASVAVSGNRRNQLWRVEASSGIHSVVAIAGEPAFNPATAHNGRSLAFSRPLSNVDLYIVQPGRTPHTILSSTWFDANPRFSPDGSRIVFASSRTGDGLFIWTGNADGTGAVQLTNGPERYHGSPSWSPDGRVISYDAYQSNTVSIYTVPSAGGEPRKITPGVAHDITPAWSSDGQWIYFVSDRTGTNQIWRMHPDGTGPAQVTISGGSIVLPSKDGRALFLVKSTGILVPQPIYAYDLASGIETAIIPDCLGRAYTPVEDGIYYVANANRKFELRFYDFSTRRTRNIMPIPWPPGLGLSLTPDRKTFLFSASEQSGSDIMMIENFR